VSTPVSWKEVEGGVRIEDFTIENVPARLKKLGDLWKPLLTTRRRFDLGQYI
jgi:bifunctional non-homologous end joining protein LigD